MKVNQTTLKPWPKKKNPLKKKQTSAPRLSLMYNVKYSQGHEQARHKVKFLENLVGKAIQNVEPFKGFHLCTWTQIS